MAKKKVSAVVKIQIPAGQASPAPPVGTALGPHGIAIMDFTKAYNAQTECYSYDWQLGSGKGGTASGSAVFAIPLVAKGYNGVKQLTRDTAGNWTGKAMRNNVEVAVTLDTAGNVREQ